MTELIKVTPSQVDTILGQIRTASALTDLTEARARIEAARAWAKVHGQVKELRLDLLRVEVEALVRVVELGGIDTLPAKDRKAARHLASLTLEERQSLVASSGSATTAAGMLRSIWQEEELRQRRRQNRDLGQRMAELPELADDAAVQDFVRVNTFSVASVLGQLVERYVEAGDEFTVGEIADEVIHEAAIGEFAHDPDIEAGVQEVVRKAIKRQPVIKVDGTILPRVITALSDAGNHIRIPVENAAVGHLRQMIALRRDQEAQDRAATDELDVVLARLEQMPGSSDESRIGDLIAASLSECTTKAAS